MSTYKKEKLMPNENFVFDLEKEMSQMPEEQLHKFIQNEMQKEKIRFIKEFREIVKKENKRNFNIDK